jgi:hypothetical protein
MARPKSAEPDVITRGLALAAAHEFLGAASGESRSLDNWENPDHAQLTSDIMSGKVSGISREGNISPESIEKAKNLADQVFMKVLQKDFRDGSYYRTIIAHRQMPTQPQKTRPIENKATGKQKRRGAAAAAKTRGKAGKRGGGPDACVCMIRAHEMGLELTCLTEPTPDEEFELGLISQNLAYRVTETCIRLASGNLGQIMASIVKMRLDRGAGATSGEGSGNLPTKLQVRAGSSWLLAGGVCVSVHPVIFITPRHDSLMLLRARASHHRRGRWWRWSGCRMPRRPCTTAGGGGVRCISRSDKPTDGDFPHDEPTLSRQCLS